MFEYYDKRIGNINALLNKYGINDISEAMSICDKTEINPLDVPKIVQPICFEDVCYAFMVGTAIALKSKEQNPEKIALYIGEALQSFCIDGSVAASRAIGLGHGRLAARLLSEDTKCFAFLAGHESFAAAEGAIGIADSANKIRVTPLKVILVGLGKDAARIISRVNGFNYVHTDFNYETSKLTLLDETRFSNSGRGQIRCYGTNDVREGVAIMDYEKTDISITGNSTNPTRFQHPVAGIYKKHCNDIGRKYFSVASGGGTGRTLHPDNMAAGPASYGLTDTMGRMHSDAQFAGSSSVPAHVEMMGFVGIGNNPLVGAIVKLVNEIKIHS